MTRTPGPLVPLRWLRRSTVTVVLLPHAGGGASLFHDWPSALPDSCDVVAVQYPGHETRLAEGLEVSAREIAAETAAALHSRAPGDTFVVFGHSMGALIGLEVALELERQGNHVAVLLAAASPPPGQRRTDVEQALALTDAEFLEGILRARGNARRLPSELYELLLPILRADYRLVADHWRTATFGKLSCPVIALGGRDDPDADPAAMAGWKAHASGAFRCEPMPGGHFFPFDSHHTRSWIAALTRQIARYEQGGSLDD
jgi:surfactin synthase thioesterase subunit